MNDSQYIILTNEEIKKLYHIIPHFKNNEYVKQCLLNA
jgi:hypothetical protein